MKPAVITVLLCLLMTLPVFETQGQAFRKIAGRSIDFSFKKALSESGLGRDDFKQARLDSNSNAAFDALWQLLDSASFSAIARYQPADTLSLFPPARLRPSFRLIGGALYYDWNSQKGIDSLLYKGAVSQHTLVASANMLVADMLPLTATYFERQTNSPFLANYRDIRLEFNAPAFRKIQADRYRRQVSDITARLHDPLTERYLNVGRYKIKRIQSLLDSPDFQLEYMDAKEYLLIDEHALRYPENMRDSVQHRQEQVVAVYERLQALQKRYGQLNDSLRRVYIETEQKIQRLRKLAGDDLTQPGKLAEVATLMGEYGLTDKKLEKTRNLVSAVHKLALGQTSPYFSPLTVGNINVNGIHIEMSKGRLLYGLAAGAVSLRPRDYLFNKEKARLPQRMLAAQLGYGRRDRNHLLLTYFTGTRAVLNAGVYRQLQSIRGLSIALQYLVAENHRLNMEVAKSSNPAQLYDPGKNSRSLDFSDRQTLAYHARWRSVFPRWHTKLEGQYQYNGMNFQNFSGYKVNATASSWYLRAEQGLWKNQLQLQGALRKNDFSNPFVLQRYNANTVFKQLTARFHRRHWPAIAAGWMPFTQYLYIDSAVYENQFQSFNTTLSHRYKLGTRPAGTIINFNRFYHPAQDSGLVNYNASNFMLNQIIEFQLYTARVSLSHTQNAAYSMEVADAVIEISPFRQARWGFGAKLIHLDGLQTKMGFHFDTKIDMKKWGMLNLQAERNYLPGYKAELVENSFFSRLCKTIRLGILKPLA